MVWGDSTEPPRKSQQIENHQIPPAAPTVSEPNANPPALQW